MAEFMTIHYNAYEILWDYTKNYYDFSFTDNSGMLPYRIRLRNESHSDFLLKNERVADCGKRLLDEVISYLLNDFNPNQYTSYKNLRWYKLEILGVTIDEKKYPFEYGISNYYFIKDEFGNKFNCD